jgi:protoporphyrin/coproporphyrin ferrochelatase
MTRTAVLLMAYGTPRSRDEILPYYTDIRRGRPPTPELLEELTQRYEAIGGLSPLAELTEAQRDVLQAALEEHRPGRYQVAIGLKHAHPTIEEAVDRAGRRRRHPGDRPRAGTPLLVVLHRPVPRAGTGGGRAEHGVEVLGIESWATLPEYVEFLAGGVRRELAGLPANTKVLFTAHSLPQRIIDAGDPYPQELEATAEAVAAAVGLTRWSGWGIAWQSAGRTPEPWIGPDILAVIDDLAVSEAASGLLVCPCGFVADHLEVLYDLDLEARRRAEDRELAFGRVPVLNADPVVLGALAARIVALDEA